MTRIGKYFELKMDSGEGRYRNETYGAPDARELMKINMYQIVSGAHVVFSAKPEANGQDLNNSKEHNLPVFAMRVSFTFHTGICKAKISLGTIICDYQPIG